MRVQTTSSALCLLLALTLGLGLVGATATDSGAYFSDCRTGEFGGVYGSEAIDPPLLLPGSSKPMHWSSGGTANPGNTIAELDGSGLVTLRFGDAPPGHSETKPDVLRMTSSAAVDQHVSISVDGEILRFVDDIDFGKQDDRILRAGETERLGIRIVVPGDALPGQYTGELVIRVEGCAEALRCPMTVEVDSKKPKGSQQPVGEESTQPPSAREAPDQRAGIAPYEDEASAPVAEPDPTVEQSEPDSRPATDTPVQVRMSDSSDQPAEGENVE